MNAFEKFLHLINSWRMETPKFYGLYHWIWIFIMITGCTLVCLFRKRISKKAINLTLIVWGTTLILLEILKQLICSFSYSGGVATWKYAWYAFPFQFCSLPLYLALPAGIAKEGKFKDFLLCFIGLFAILGGIITIAYPNTVFVTRVFLNVHTMIWHTSMVIIAVMLLATGTIKLKWSSFGKGSVVYAVYVILSLIVNVTFGRPHGLNMFFISPYRMDFLEQFGPIFAKVPFAVYFIIYVAGFAGFAALVLLAAQGCSKLSLKIQSKKRA